MAERGWDTAFWTDPFVQDLSIQEKLLFVYLATSPHCNQAGLYEITIKTIAFDTGIPPDDLPSCLENLKPKIVWYPEHNLIWVKNFAKRQTKSPKFLIAVAKCLKSIKHPPLIQEFLDYNNTLSIPYEYSINSVAISPSASAGTNASADKEKGGLRGKEGNNTASYKLPDFIDKDTWNAYMEMRRQKRAKPTEYAIHLLFNKLKRFKEEGDDPNEVLKRSIMNGWTGIFPLDRRGDGTHKQGKIPQRYIRPEELRG